MIKSGSAKTAKADKCLQDRIMEIDILIFPFTSPIRPALGVIFCAVTCKRVRTFYSKLLGVNKFIKKPGSVDHLQLWAIKLIIGQNAS